MVMSTVAPERPVVPVSEGVQDRLAHDRSRVFRKVLAAQAGYHLVAPGVAMDEPFTAIEDAGKRSDALFAVHHGSGPRPGSLPPNELYSGTGDELIRPFREQDPRLRAASRGCALRGEDERHRGRRGPGKPVGA